MKRFSSKSLYRLGLLAGFILLSTSCGLFLGESLHYRKGDLERRVFRQGFRPGYVVTKGDYYRVWKDRRGRVKQVLIYTPAGEKKRLVKYIWDGSELIERRENDYTEGGSVFTSWVSHRLHLIYEDGRLHQSREWDYPTPGTLDKEEIRWFDYHGRLVLKESVDSGNRLLDRCTFTYDYKSRLDQAHKHYYNPDEDPWLRLKVLFDNNRRIKSEEEYLADGKLLAFYRYRYDPAGGFLVELESFNASERVSIHHKFDEKGRLIQEFMRDAHMKHLSETRYTFDDFTKKVTLHRKGPGAKSFTQVLDFEDLPRLWETLPPAGSQLDSDLF